MSKKFYPHLLQWSVRIALIMVLAMLALFPATMTTQAYAVPTFTVSEVVPDVSVTIITANFPAATDFTVRMGAYGTLGIGGIAVATLNSGAGGAFSATFSIPASLAGSSQIAIRLESAGIYYAYNWFYNSVSPVTPPVPGYTGIPTFSITTVEADTKVTVQTSNLTPSQDFTVRMGAYGTYGLGGIVVGTFNSGTGGSQSLTFDIPAALAGSLQIAMRMDCPAGYYAYNWFWNNTTTTTPGPVTPPGDGYSGYPTFSITNVIAGEDVSIAVVNLPKEQDFVVRMGAYGTYAVGGIEVATFNSEEGGAKAITFDIPAALAGSYQIAIRMDSTSGSGLNAYNWFYNNTTSGVTPPPPSGYSGYPTFSITAVVKDSTVTVATANLPPDQNFSVRMGAYGTYAVGGIEVATFNSGAGGAQSMTFDIPTGLAGSLQIALRMDSTSGSGLYAYNWFWNNTTP